MGAKVSAGRIEIDVWQGGYPTWCIVRIDGREVAQLHHKELADLGYAVERAKVEARAELGDKHKGEV